MPKPHVTQQTYESYLRLKQCNDSSGFMFWDHFASKQGKSKNTGYALNVGELAGPKQNQFLACLKFKTITTDTSSS